ncbi:proline--tRNA ligase [Selenomonas sp. TAMA-11512]|uniref:proline--tRNA ligase n=1 Tax=Selenomonas sp. TAMA-11512 TaxID=3095337 RepID=UPI00309183C5|nr:proline--tRNA ligase [Selenomonas sp. TAMA-11512]
MRASKLYAPTLREVPSDAEVTSHRLMLRAGLIRKAASGMYTYLPLGWRVIRKLERIIREEMEAKDGQEIMMPIVQPAEIWQETKRWDAFGPEMFRLKDVHEHDFCLGPTHEEMITTLVRNEVRSYKQLPLNLFQIQNKYRDERRPRFGLMRSREFIMKDAYSFDADEAGADVAYRDMYDAYTRIFTRCGLNFRPVEADSGAIGGGHTHEFTVLAESGESEIASCTSCDFAANIEKAELKTVAAPDEPLTDLKKIETPDCKTIEAVADFLSLPLDKTIKAVAFQDEEGTLVLAFVRGDHEVNEVKLANAVEARELVMAEESAIEEAGGTPGYMSPIGIRKGTKIVVDATVMQMKNACAGANEVGYHYTGLTPSRDFDAERILVRDIRLMQEGDPCPHCGHEVVITRGIEVGQVFKLGTKYSEALGATFLDENGKSKPLIMGCYGIGVGRTAAAAIEQNNDEHGIIWPRAIAPFEVCVLVVNARKEDELRLAEEVYQELKTAGFDVLLDDRPERAGVKFKDADLIGYPVRVTIGPKTAESGEIELKVRRTGETFTATRETYQAKLRELLDTL